MSAGEGPGDAGTSRPDDDGDHQGANASPGGAHPERGNRRLLIPLGVLAVPVAAVAVVLLLTDALDGRGMPLWLIALAVTVVGVAVLSGGYGAMRRFAGRQQEDRRAGFRTEVHRWAQEHGWQVRDGRPPDAGAAQDAEMAAEEMAAEGMAAEGMVPEEMLPEEMAPQEMLPEGLLPPALEPVRLEQIITGSARSRRVQMESWSVDLRRTGSAMATSRVGQLIRIQTRADLPLVAVTAQRSTDAIPAISPPVLAHHRVRRSGGVVYIGEPGAIAQVIETLGVFAEDVRRTGAWVLLRPGAVNLFFATEPDVAVLQVRVDMGIAMAEELDASAESGSAFGASGRL